MSIEAMKQALEALKNSHPYSNMDKDLNKHSEAITALRQAIEQAEQPVHTDHPMRHWDRTCPACVYESDISQERVDETAKDRYEWNEIQCPCGHKMYAKYTKREWVGLTTDERDALVQRADKLLDHIYEYGTASEGIRPRLKSLFTAVEAKLKEKNT
jgi:hypothetical protein